jgi:phosphosulfolactate phosphohydrolase-like enzyme
MAEPSTPGFDVTRYEIRRFMSALGLSPGDVESVRIAGKRVVATLTDGSTIHIRITESRGKP